MNRRRWVIAVIVALFVLPTSMQAFAWQKIVSFGDSLSDDGNGGYNNFPDNLLLGPTGPSSDGQVWLWYLADSMLEPSDPMLGPELEGRAIGGARTSGPVWDGIGDIGMEAQIDRYIIALEGEDQSYDLSGILFTVWIGGNDFLANAENPFAAIEPAIESIELSIQRLIDIGAEDILIMNLPDLGLAPGVRVLQGAEASYGYTAASAEFNALLHQAICNLKVINRGNQVKLYMADSFKLLQYAVENGEALGYEDVDYPCSWTDGPSCDTALFYDDIHPTTFTHKYLAALALGQVAEARVSKEMKKMLKMLNPLKPREPFWDTCFE